MVKGIGMTPCLSQVCTGKSLGVTMIILYTLQYGRTSTVLRTYDASPIFRALGLRVPVSCKQLGLLLEETEEWSMVYW
jgi:hypothetical protein